VNILFSVSTVSFGIVICTLSVNVVLSLGFVITSWNVDSEPVSICVNEFDMMLLIVVVLITLLNIFSMVLTTMLSTVCWTSLIFYIDTDSWCVSSLYFIWS